MKLLESISIFYPILWIAGTTFGLGYLVGFFGGRSNYWTIEELEKLLKKLKGGKKDG